MSCLSSRISVCPPPHKILCLSLATSSSSSPIGVSLVLTGLLIPKQDMYYIHLKQFCMPLFCTEVWKYHHLALMQKRYWIRTVMQKKITPSMAMAKRFLPTMSQARGERKRFSPENMHKHVSRSRNIMCCMHAAEVTMQCSSKYRNTQHTQIWVKNVQFSVSV